MMKETQFGFQIHITVSIMTIVYSWYIGGEDIHILITNESK